MEDILNYTLAQFHGFGGAIARLENQRYAALLNVITIGSRGDSKAVEKMAKALSG